MTTSVNTHQKHIFIDTNILLDFFSYSKDDLEEVEKVAVLMQNNDIKLYVTRQVVDEFNRNRDKVVSESFNKFKSINPFAIGIPYVCRTYADKYDDLMNAVRKFNTIKNSIEEVLSTDIENNTLSADKVIKKLFEFVEVIELDSETIEKAFLRFKLGNPPGKGKSHGDAINWEVLKKVVPIGFDLYFVSADGDFKSEIGYRKFNTFLKDEWAREKHSKIVFYDQLSDFFKENFPTIILNEEESKNKFISDLSQSTNFATTHILILELSKYGNFTLGQIKQLIDIAISNTQIYWIAEDKDVNSFFTDIITGKEYIIDDNTLSVFNRLFKKEQNIVKEDPSIPIPASLALEDINF